MLRLCLNIHSQQQLHHGAITVIDRIGFLTIPILLLLLALNDAPRQRGSQKINMRRFQQLSLSNTPWWEQPPLRAFRCLRLTGTFTIKYKAANYVYKIGSLCPYVKDNCPQESRNLRSPIISLIMLNSWLGLVREGYGPKFNISNAVHSYGQ